MGKRGPNEGTIYRCRVCKEPKKNCKCSKNIIGKTSNDMGNQATLRFAPSSSTLLISPPTTSNNTTTINTNDTTPITTNDTAPITTNNDTSSTTNMGNQQAILTLAPSSTNILISPPSNTNLCSTTSMNVSIIVLLLF